MKNVVVVKTGINSIVERLKIDILVHKNMSQVGARVI